MNRKITAIEMRESNSWLRVVSYLYRLECGHLVRGFFGPSPEFENCRECDAEAEDMLRIPSLVAGSVHSRYRKWCGKGLIYFYRRAPESPSGVMLLGSITATRAAEDLIRSIDSRKAPLSPTEGLSA